MNDSEHIPAEPRDDVREGEAPEAAQQQVSHTATSDPAPANPCIEAFAGFPLAESSAPQMDVSQAQYPPDLRVPWTPKDVILFLLFYILSPIVLAIPMLIAAAVLRRQDVNSLTKDVPMQAMLAIIAQAAAALLSLGYLWVLAKTRHAGSFWGAIGWKPLAGDATKRRVIILSIVIGGIFLAGIVTGVSSVIGESKKLPIEEMIQTRQTMVLLMVFGVLVAPAVEETVFRGLIYPMIARRAGIPASIAVTGILFGLVHSMQLWGGWAQIALIVFVGMILTWLRATRRTVWASYLLHLSYNSTLFLAALVATGGFRHMQNLR